MHALAAVLLLVSSSLTLVCSVGLAVMRDPLQRLHFLSPPTAISAPLLAVVVFLDGQGVQAGLKVSLIALLLVLMNAVGSHATARAVRVHQHGHWEPAIDDHVAIVREDEPSRGASETRHDLE